MSRRGNKCFPYFQLMYGHIRSKCTLIIFILMMVAVSTYCQPYYFSHYQVENGLSNNAVMCSMQDHHGFMWFGTRDGLNRFDGRSFKVFKHHPADTNSIGSNAITCLSQDKENAIWAGTEKGIYKYDEAKESFTQLKVAGDASIRNLKVRGDEIWYISLYTLYRYNVKTGDRKTFIIDQEVTAYCFLKDETLWITTSAGIVAKYDPGTDSFTQHNLFDQSPNSVSKWIESIFDTGTGILLIGTSNAGLKTFNTETFVYKNILTFNQDQTEIIVREILAISDDEYWIASQSGIYILNLKTGVYKNLTREQNDPYSLSDNIVHTLCKDKEGGIWAGTYFGGINYYPRQYITFKKYFPFASKNSISGYAVREICNDNDGNIWIGTEDAGLNKFDPVKGTFDQIKSVSYSNIHGLLVNGENVWVGTYLHGLDIINARSGKKVAHYNTGNSKLGSNFIYSLYKTPTSQILVATDKGLYKYIVEENDFRLVPDVKKVFFRALYQDQDGTTWAGTYGDGLFYFNERTGKKGQFLNEPSNPFSLPGNLINKIYEDSKGVLWLATEAGLAKFVKGTNRFEKVSTEDGLPSNVIYSMQEDSKGFLWISTSKGLVSYSPLTEEMKVYTKSHGLLTDQFNYNSGYKDKKGQLFFGSVKGLVSFYPDSIREYDYAPPVFLTGFQLNNEELTINNEGSPLENSITFTRKINLSYDQSTFSIDFAALTFTSPNTVNYVYKMEGLDEKWTRLQTNRKIYFTELKPGEYTFMVSAIVGATGKPGEPATLIIKIFPPAWKTWWAYTIYLVTIISIALLVIRHFYNRAKEKNKAAWERLEFEKERENYKDKIQFFTNVAHEIRTPLTLIKGPMENIMEKADQIPLIRSSLEIMNKNTDKLLHLSGQLLDFRKVEMNGFRLNLSREDISELLREQHQSFSVIAKQHNITLSLDCPKFLHAYIDLEAFNKILSNLWDNAVKYAQSTVFVSLTSNDLENKQYTITFKNDGYLVPIEMKDEIFMSFYRAKETAKLPGTGIGLTLSRSLAELHAGTLELCLPEKNMNTFKLRLPVDPIQYGSSSENK